VPIQPVTNHPIFEDDKPVLWPDVERPPVESQVVVPDLPTGGAHVTRTVLLDGEGRLFVSVGSSCNVCQEEDDRRAAISVYAADGSGGRIWARGLRNAVGLAINPTTGELWATNNGRDFLGDDAPPETVYVVTDGLDAGWPHCHAGDIVDPEFGQEGACRGVAVPAAEMQAHTAPLGLAFYTGSQFPAEYQGDLFVALHGSWNRSGRWATRWCASPSRTTARRARPSILRPAGSSRTAIPCPAARPASSWRPTAACSSATTRRGSSTASRTAPDGRTAAVARWLDPQPVHVPQALRRAVGGHPLVAETLARRGILTPEAARTFLDPGAYALASPFDLPDMDRAVERVRRAVDRGEPVAVWGDFDADGQTATALLVERLGAMGASVRWAVPSRRQGHGLRPDAVQRLVQEEGARLILTCDTGITAYAAAELAAGLGADLIITDHHTPGEQLPPAMAVINPWRLPPGHALGPLTGVGVAYALAVALDPEGAQRALDLLALGTVADVGSLTGDNRPLVQRGLEMLRRTPRPGLQAVYRRAGVRPEGLTEEHVAFVLGPRLNALGRLADAGTGVELLLTRDPDRAGLLAADLEALNARRQWLTRQVMDGALAQIRHSPALVRDYGAVVLSDPDWLPGITGIVAGRLAERLGKPAVLIAAPATGELARGSGRSVPGVDLVAALRACAPLLEDYGGHPGAAGFSLAPEHIPELRVALSQAVASQPAAALERVLALDAIVELPELNLELVAQIGRLAPFGRGNPPLILGVRDLRVLSEAALGPAGEHRRVTVEDGQDRTQTVFWWQGAGWPLPQGRFDLAVTAVSHDYQGLPEVQVQWIDAQERETRPAVVGQRPAPAAAVRDYRSVDSEDDALQVLRDEGSVQVWAEGMTPPGVEGRTRHELEPGGRLAVWTVPPGPRELLAVLAAVRPTELMVFARDAGLDRATPFLQRLAGAAQFALRARDGWVDLEAAAARLGHRVATVQAGLEWLAAAGQVRLVEKARERWRLAPGTGQADAPALRLARRRLGDLLIETAAYRAYFRRAPADSLGR
jgi:single-stranded-DNA-specific exonuclease